MTDLSEFEAVHTPAARRCWFQRLAEPQREKVVAAREAGYSCKDIATVVSAWGIPLGASGASRHFGRCCACD